MAESLLLSVLQSSAGIEFEENNIPIFDDIISTLLTIFAGSLGRGFGALLLEINEMHDLSHDETLLEICVNASGCLWGFCCFLQRENGNRYKINYRFRYGYRIVYGKNSALTWMVQALTSSGPEVKKYSNCRALYPVVIIFSRIPSHLISST